MPELKTSLDEKLSLSPTGAELIFTEYARTEKGDYIPPTGNGRYSDWCQRCPFWRSRRHFCKLACNTRLGKCRSSNRRDGLMGYWRRKSDHRI